MEVNMELQLLNTDITKVECDAIVNAANKMLFEGGGVCGAIFEKAGREDLRKACDAIGGCKTGYAVITPGFKLKAKYIIHAVGPIYRDESSGKFLSMAYYNSLKVASDAGITSIAFPSISTGIYGFPKKPAAKLAFKAINDFFKDYPQSPIKKVIICLLGDTYDIFVKEFSNLKNEG